MTETERDARIVQLVREWAIPGTAQRIREGETWTDDDALIEALAKCFGEEETP